VHPIQRNLLISCGDIHPSTGSKPACRTGLDILLENIARAHSIFAGDLHVHAPCELAIIEQGGNAAGDTCEFDGSGSYSIRNDLS